MKIPPLRNPQVVYKKLDALKTGLRNITRDGVLNRPIYFLIHQ